MESFDKLCSGASGYSFNLVSLQGITDREEAVRKVERQIRDTLASLQEDRDKTIEFPYYIGITSTEAKQRKPLNPTKEETTKKDVISRRWQGHKREGKNGMVLVTVITDEIATNLGFKKEGNYSAAKKCVMYLEQRLQMKLLGNEDYHPGSESSYTEAYPLYVAYKYDTKRNGQQPAQQIQTAQPSTKGSAYYSFNLCDISNAGSIDDAAHLVHLRIHDIVRDVEYSTGRKIQLSIGHVDIAKKRGNSFNPLDPSTFNKKEIQDKWSLYKGQGKDGMFVFAVVTDSMVRGMAQTLGCKDAHECVQKMITKLQEDKALTVEQADFIEKLNGEVICCLYFTFIYLN